MDVALFHTESYANHNGQHYQKYKSVYDIIGENAKKGNSNSHDEFSHVTSPNIPIDIL